MNIEGIIMVAVIIIIGGAVLDKVLQVFIPKQKPTPPQGSN